MEVKKVVVLITLMSVFSACTNTPELETGEIKTFQLFQQAIYESKTTKSFVDAQLLISREQIDTANIPILFVELETGQNGTLTLYPGQGVGQTWLGADGATITLDQGIIKASRGMGDDVMGSSSTKPSWAEQSIETSNYSKTVSYLSGNNKIYTRDFKCKMNKSSKREILEIWEIMFKVTKYSEICSNVDITTRNNYYLDSNKIVRQSHQYHSDTIGYVLTQRLDR